ncbi:ester cyclase [Microbacterium sp. NPDC019599]|uniref:ester cyclase n=1 Tax=Microbacterium sp. NPDC019599 TaxID=3154690 RepID=UPI0033FAAF47
MSEDPKQVAERFYDIINEGSLERLDDVCAPDVRGHAGAGADLPELKRSIGSLVEAFPGLTATPRHVLQEGGLVTTWVTYEGIHRGSYAGVPGTGRRVRFMAWDLFRVEDGRIVEITQACDLFTLMNQIGALPTTAPA